MPTPAVAANTIAAALPYLAAVTAGVTNLSKTPPAISQKIQAGLAGVQVGVAALAASESAVQSQPIVARILADGQAVLQAAATMAPELPPPYGMLLGLANTMFPMLVGMVQALVATRTVVPAAAPLPAAA